MLKNKSEAPAGKVDKKEVPEIRNEVAEIGNLHGRGKTFLVSQ